jgi:hypothetical protein
MTIHLFDALGAWVRSVEVTPGVCDLVSVDERIYERMDHDGLNYIDRGADTFILARKLRALPPPTSP